MENQVSRYTALIAFVFFLSACSSNSSSSDDDAFPLLSTSNPTSSPSPGGTPGVVGRFSVGGSVAGLTGEASLELTEATSGGVVTVANDGGFVFPGTLRSGAAYEVGISTPTPGQVCEVSNGSGTVEAGDVTDIAIACTNGYNLQLSGFRAVVPSVIVAGIRVNDIITEEPVSDLVTDDFQVLENSQPIGPESFLVVESVDQESVDTKTVLVLDISTSIDASEMENVKKAAKSALFSEDEAGVKTSRLFNRQSVAIYTFDSEVELLVDFTDDVEALATAIDTIPASILERSNSTNLLGAVETAIDQWEVTIGLATTEYGYAIFLTDGVHNYDNRSADSLNLIDEYGIRKDLYAIAVGDGVSIDNLVDLVGENRRVFEVESFDDAAELGAVFTEVTDEAYRQTQGLYRVYYATPKRADTNSVEFSLMSNVNVTCPEEWQCTDSVGSSFDAGSFTDTVPTVVALISGGVEEKLGQLVLSGSDTLTIEASLRWVDLMPSFTFSVDELTGDAPVASSIDESKIAYTFPAGFMSGTITVLESETGGSATVTVERDGDGFIHAETSSLLDVAFFEELDCNALDPNKVYLHGTLSEGSSRDALVDPLNPTSFCTGFGGNVSGSVISQDGSYIYTTSNAIYKFRQDEFAYSAETGSFTYPENPTANDDTLHSPEMSSCGIGTLFISADLADIVFSCPNSVLHTLDESPYYDLGNMRALTRLSDGSLLLNDFGDLIIRKPDATLVSPVVPAGAQTIIEAKIHFDQDGNELVWLAVNYDNGEVHRWRLDVATEQVTDEGAFAAIPSGVTGSHSGKFNGNGIYFSVGRIELDDVIMKQPLASSGEVSEVIYTEANDPGGNAPYVKIHGSPLVTGM